MNNINKRKLGSEEEEAYLDDQMKEPDQVYDMENGHGSVKRARPDEPENSSDKCEAQGSSENVPDDKMLTCPSASCSNISTPIMKLENLSFRHSEARPYLYKNVEFEISLNTRMAVVGPKGSGKSTLLSLLRGDLIPTKGKILKMSQLRIVHYYKRLHERLNVNLSPLSYMMREFPEVPEDEMRTIISWYGVPSYLQWIPMRDLSYGDQCRMVFACLTWQTPHLLLLDDPSFELDDESVDALALAINEFGGGLVLASADYRLINQVASEIWVCKDHAVTKWHGSLEELFFG